jgi:hypothetical protein
MSTNAINNIIDRIVRDGAFGDRIRIERETALADSGLTPAEARFVVVAVCEDVQHDGAGRSFTALRRLARFEPLFASYSATSTKKG